jgi:SAM-dependent methyltransferase
MFSLIVPTYNEAGNILLLLESVHRLLEKTPHEIIVVDDDSPDKTWELVSARAVSQPWVRVIRRRGERGLSAAVLAGFEIARGDIFGVMDADLSHDEQILPKLIDAVAQGADIAIGSRRIPGGGAVEWPWYRKFSSTCATFLAKALLDLKLSDPMSGYFVLKRSLYDGCKERLSPMGYKILIEIYYKGRPRKVTEVPFIFRNRREGYSKMSRKVIQQYLLMLMILRLDALAQGIRYKYHTARYAKIKAWLQAGDVLDIGCGRPCETMADGAFLRLLGHGTGVDIKPLAGPFRFVQGDVLELPFPDHSFDNIVAMETLAHVTDPRQAFSELSRVLKNGGRIVISVPAENWLWKMVWSGWESTFGYMWNKTHAGTMDPAEWQRLLSQYFVIQKHRRHWYFDLLFIATPADSAVESL